MNGAPQRIASTDGVQHLDSCSRWWDGEFPQRHHHTEVSGWYAGELEEWSEGKLMKLRNMSPAAKTKNTHCQHKLGADWLERSSLEKHLGPLWGNKVNRHQQHVPAVTKGKHMLGCIGKDNSQELGEMALLFLAPRRCCMWSSNLAALSRKYIDKLDSGAQLKWSGHWKRREWGNSVCLTCRRNDSRGSNFYLQLPNWGFLEKMEPDSSQRVWTKGQETTGTTWREGDSDQTSRKYSSPWEH